MKHIKTDKNLEIRLLSERDVTVISALNEVKDKGNAGYLPLLFDLLNSNPGAIIEEEILTILGTLKTQDAVPFLAEALQAPKYHPIRRSLTAACWQNGLDYKDYLPLFVDIIIQEEWETGFEAFTVIENMIKYPEQQTIDLSVKKINNAIPDSSDKKKYLLQELLILIC